MNYLVIGFILNVAGIGCYAVLRRSNTPNKNTILAAAMVSVIVGCLFLIYPFVTVFGG